MPPEIVEVVTLVPRERQQHTAEKIVCAPPFREETVDAVPTEIVEKDFKQDPLESVVMGNEWY